MWHFAIEVDSEDDRLDVACQLVRTIATQVRARAGVSGGRGWHGGDGMEGVPWRGWNVPEAAWCWVFDASCD